MIFKYDINVKYLPKNLKDWYNCNDFSLLDIYLNDKRPSAKIKLVFLLKLILLEIIIF